ncbi:hypothetical protein Acsp06_20240 [Actinomycetospora sp. NBRC 106375]|uniref:uracil-DNA glycosylase family protein n=1 Tax=Actinomycetospora sp. NBRC 106375 TaxID=3032207 RepID=UPI0024A278E2|nr:uracil-DNA glycosylase family protein [Actinomycetospora sp. NBRC 106375]GLZ45839.1 hypothetical protein Acsp06_20240 [Actinomycetospora sp. NBRC 106375]
MPRPVWNTLAHKRGELLSRDLAPDVHAQRWAQRYDGAVGVLNRWVDHVRDTTYENLPYFDPASAGQGARVLVLLQDPSGEAEEGSGFVSRHNNDPTANNTYVASDRAKLGYDISLHWNVVPWWVANPAKPVRTLEKESVRALPYLEQMLELLDPAPTEVVVLGRPAARAWARIARRGLPGGLRDATVALAPHPSPLVYPRVDAATGRGNSDLIVEAMRLAGQRARGEKVRPAAGGPAGRRRPF